MDSVLVGVIAFLISGVIFTFVGYFARKKIAESKIKSAEEEAKKIVEDSKKEAEQEKKEAIFKANEEIMKSRKELEDEIRERRGEVKSQEKRIEQREENLENRITSLEKKESEYDKKEKELEDKMKEIEKQEAVQFDELQRISGLTKDEAKEELVEKLKHEVATEEAVIIKQSEEKIKETADKCAKEVVGYAISKCAADHTAETTVSIVALPSDEMKGRIIGREGRNIKALETLTGVDLIIDDTPEAVVISGFDPLRREIARMTLEKLIDDGRIHPAKIEEMVEKSREELAQIITDEGERAAMECGVIGLHPDLVKLIGKLKYRTSYGQNVLSHSIEVSNLARIMAEELGIDSTLARTAGLLHDIGKALDHDVEGTHVQIGVEILNKYKGNGKLISDKVINAVEAHHDDVEPQTIEAVLVKAADAISASRPGARRETLDSYIKRLEQLEGIANSFDGVDSSFAIQAGREVRIIVKPEKISDAEMTVLARDVAKKVENEMDYPGQIKVNIIRETRVTDFAK